MPNKLKRSAASALLAILLAVPVFAQPGHNASQANIHIWNFGTVDGHFYRGSQPYGHDYADLAALGIRTVIDFQKWGDNLEEAAVVQHGMKYVRIPMTTRVTPTQAQLEQFLAIVNDPANQPVYVHCAGGRHRTGLMTAVYRMTKDGWSGADAFAEMKRYNFGADYLHPEFKQFVLTYHPVKTPAPATVAANAASALIDAVTR